jgi:hypothetical protein
MIFVLEPEANGAFRKYERAAAETVGKVRFCMADLSNFIYRYFDMGGKYPLRQEKS